MVNINKFVCGLLWLLAGVGLILCIGHWHSAVYDVIGESASPAGTVAVVSVTDVAYGLMMRVVRVRYDFVCDMFLGGEQFLQTDDGGQEQGHFGNQ